MNQKALIEIIQEKIDSYEKQVSEVMGQSHSAFEKYKQFYSLLEEDLANITHFSLEEIEDILDATSIPNLDKEEELKKINSILDLLELNQTKGTTFQLTEEQNGYLEKFKEQVKVLENMSKEKMSEQLEGVSDVTHQLKKLRALLGKLEDSKNKEYILEGDLLGEILSSLDEQKQQEMLYDFLKYNHSLYTEKMNQKEIKERPRLNIEEVKEIFQNFSYDFMELNSEDQDALLTYGNIQKIPDIFECLERNYLPRFDLKRNGKLLVAILISSDAQIMEDIISFCEEKEISPHFLFMLTPAFIKQEKHVKGENRSLIGRSIDFKNNVDFLEEAGFDISYVLRKCKELLIMSNIELVSSYQKFNLYGFSIPQEEEGQLCSNMFSCFLSNYFDEIADQFIEIHAMGHSYIKEHLSRVSTILSPHDLLFYRLYLAHKKNENIEDVIDCIDYQNLTEENKKELTGTISVACDSKKEFDSAVEKHRGKEEELYNLIFNDEGILKLEQYIDPNDSLRYSFEGIFISKPKVLRIYNILKNEHLDALEDSLFYAVTYNSILNQEEVEKLRHMIGGQ